MDEQLNGGHFYANEVIITPNSHGGGSNGGTEDIYEYPSYPLQNNHHPAANRPFPRSVSTTLAQNRYGHQSKHLICLHLHFSQLLVPIACLCAKTKTKTKALVPFGT